MPQRPSRRVSDLDRPLLAETPPTQLTPEGSPAATHNYGCGNCDVFSLSERNDATSPSRCMLAGSNPRGSSEQGGRPRIPMGVNRVPVARLIVSRSRRATWDPRFVSSVAAKSIGTPCYPIASIIADRLSPLVRRPHESSWVLAPCRNGASWDCPSRLIVQCVSSVPRV